MEPSRSNATGRPGFELRWLCSARRRRPLSRGAFALAGILFAALRRLLPGRVRCEVWIRYRRRLTDVGQPPAVVLTRLSDDIVEQLRRHPLHGRDQMRSGIRFWEHGLREACIWLEDQEPLCMQWLFLPDHEERLRKLPGWSDIYLPLPPAAGYAENIFTFPRGQRRRGGAATDFAAAMFAHARAAGLTRLYTHVSDRNLGARRWAERTGWEPYGTIRRYGFDLPLLRSRHWCLHGLEPVWPLPSAVRTPAPAAPQAGYVDDGLRLPQLSGR